jgi:hypothetical protein
MPAIGGEKIMTKAVFSLGMVVVLAGAMIVAAQAPQHDINAVGWMAGSWELRQGDVVTEEHWTNPAGGTMIGMSRVSGRGKTMFFEFLRIEARADGLYYVAQPKGRPPVEFKATEVTASRVIFANPQHDFPKRISYRRNEDGSITARVEGDADSKEKPEEYAYKLMK